MRCNNCGWDNPNGLTRCEKCNSKLDGGMNAAPQPVGNYAGTEIDRGEGASQALNKTVLESDVFGNMEKQASAPSACPSCGYPLRENAVECPMCHKPVTAGGNTVREINLDEKPKMNFKGTVMPKCNCVTEIGFSLTPIANEGEFKTPEKVFFEEEHVELTRANVDSNNRTITSKTQAVMDFNGEKRKWMIQDKSAQQYTFIRCDRSLRLSDGDIIMLGDRKFEFRNLGQKAGQENPQSDFSGTIVMGRQQANAFAVKLIPMPYPGEDSAPAERMFKGETHKLNRDSLDPDNYTITSKVQAELQNLNGEWYIKNASTLKTTYLLCKEPTGLNDGDVILMGNRNFTFNC